MKAVRPSNVGYFEMLAYATVRITLFNATKEGHRLFGGAPNQSMDFNLVLRFFLALLICSTRFATNKKKGQQNQTNQNRVILGGAREKKSNKNQTIRFLFLFLRSILFHPSLPLVRKSKTGSNVNVVCN